MLELKDGDTVEIGPGHGELTKQLIINNQQLKIIAIEKIKVVEFLKDSPKVKMLGGIEGDLALKVFQFLFKNYKIVGNTVLHYGISFRILGELKKQDPR